MMRLLLYDLDGTLVDTLEDLSASANHMLRTLGSPTISSREVRRHVGRGVRELVRRCLKSDEPSRIDDGVRIYLAYYAQHRLDHARLYPGVREALEHFKSRRQAVVTNKPNPFSRDILEALGIARYFIDVIAGNSEFPKKPDPGAVRALMRAEAIGPEETLLIGDSPIDVETARNAGVGVVCLLHGLSDEAELSAASPDALVSDFAELLSLAKTRGW
jgi:phosphoglycolate phosphatase